MRRNLPLSRHWQGRMHPWGLQTLSSSIFTLARQCTGQLAARSDTNQPRWTSPGTGVVGATTWTMAASAVAVNSSLVVARVQHRQCEPGCHESHEGNIRRWRVGDGLVLHV
jgi:hypothetical protein